MEGLKRNIAKEIHYFLYYLMAENQEMSKYGKKSRNVKIGISLRALGSKYEIKNYLGISMVVMKKEDIFAHKLVALFERKQIANRDLFDIWFFK